MLSDAPKRYRGFVLSPVGWEKLQARMHQIEKEKGCKLTQQGLIKRIQLIDPQGLHPITLRKILGRQIGVDERSLRLLFQAIDLTLERLDYKLAFPKDDDIELGKQIEESPALTIPAPTGPDFPGGPLPLDSPFYIEPTRPLGNACQELSRPGGLVRIKAPQKSGKNSLALRLLRYTESLSYTTVRVDFQQVDEELFSSLDRFLRWFCATLSYQLGVTPTTQEYWNEDAGSKVSCTIYLQNVLLKPLPSPVVLVLNEVNRLFEYPVIFQEFLPLLRSWYQEAKFHPILQKLRFILIYSTEIYVSLHLNQSPFNIGLPIELTDLTLEEIRTLAVCYGLPEAVALPLSDLVGGRPYLVQLGLYYLSSYPISLEQFLDEATTPAGIYSTHLNECWVNLQRSPELTAAFKQVLESDGQICLNPVISYQLESLGLVKLNHHSVVPSCNLYQQFFSVILCQTMMLPSWSASPHASPTVSSARAE